MNKNIGRNLIYFIKFSQHDFIDSNKKIISIQNMHTQKNMHDLIDSSKKMLSTQNMEQESDPHPDPVFQIQMIYRLRIRNRSKMDRIGNPFQKCRHRYLPFDFRH